MYECAVKKLLTHPLACSYWHQSKGRTYCM